MTRADEMARRNPTRRQSWPRRVVAALAVGLLATVTVSWAKSFVREPANKTGPIPWNIGGTTTQFPAPQDPQHVFPFYALSYEFRSIQSVDVYRTPWYEGAVTNFDALPNFDVPPRLPAWSSMHRLNGRVPLPSRDGPDSGFAEFATGWPMPALMGRVRIPWGGGGRGGPGRVDIGLTLPAFPNTVVGEWYAMWGALPILPLWPGFVVDVATYAGAWLAVGLIMAGWRNRCRRGWALDGCCPNCGYDRAGLVARGDAEKQGVSGGNVCPECGAIFAAPPTVQPRSGTSPSWICF